MNQINAAIIDNEARAIQVIASLATKIPMLQIVYTATNPFEGLAYVQSNPVDLLFLDIQMEGITGFELIQQLEKPPLFIICSAYSEYGIQGFELDALDYLLKPIEFARFTKAVRKAEHALMGEGTSRIPHVPIQNDYVFVKTESKLRKIMLHDIIHVRPKRNYTLISLLSQRKTMKQTIISWEVEEIEAKEGFGKFVEKLPYPEFVRVHNSHAVALNMVHEIGSGHLKMLHLPDRTISTSTQGRALIIKLMGPDSLGEVE